MIAFNLVFHVSKSFVQEITVKLTMKKLTGFHDIAESYGNINPGLVITLPTPLKKVE